VASGVRRHQQSAAKHHPWTAAWFFVPAIGAGILVVLGIYMLLRW
jgi:hypothetical protein